MGERGPFPDCSSCPADVPPAPAGTPRGEAYFTAPDLAPTHSALGVPTEISGPTATTDTCIPAPTPLQEADNWAVPLSQNLSLCCMATYFSLL